LDLDLTAAGGSILSDWGDWSGSLDLDLTAADAGKRGAAAGDDRRRWPAAGLTGETQSRVPGLGSMRG
jgi:hypothetical protein